MIITLSEIALFTASIIIFIFVILLLIYRYLLPVFTFPKLTGMFHVGTRSYFWKDTARKETHSSDPLEHREIYVQFWYPALYNPFKTKSLYIPEVLNHIKRSIKNTRYSPLLLIMNKLFPEYSHSIEQADVSSEQDSYPIIVFSHGLGGLCSFHTALLENLASHGYIIVGLDHPYSSYVSILSDGRNIKKTAELEISIIKLLKDCDLKSLNCIEEELKIWQADVQFVIGKLYEINKSPTSDFFGKLNLERMGICGHSLGGALAAQICLNDKRIKAGVSIDGSMLQQTSDSDFQTPFMFILGVLLAKGAYPRKKILNKIKMSRLEWDKAIKQYKDRIDKVCEKLGDNGFKYIIEGAGHFSFTDISLMKACWASILNLDIGNTPSPEIIKATNKYLVDFFNKYI